MDGALGKALYPLRNAGIAEEQFLRVTQEVLRRPGLRLPGLRMPAPSAESDPPTAISAGGGVNGCMQARQLGAADYRQGPREQFD